MPLASLRPRALRRRVQIARYPLAAITLLLFGMAIAVPLSLSLVLTQRDVRSAEGVARTSARAAARLAARNVDDLIVEIATMADTATHLDGFWQPDGDDLRDKMLQAVVRPHAQINALNFYTLDFEQHGTSLTEARTARPDIANRAYAHEAAATGKLSVTAQLLRSPLPPYQLVLPAAVPVSQPGHPDTAGLVVAGLKLDRLPTLWDDIALPQGSVVLLVDSRQSKVLTTNRTGEQRIGQ
jgi:hypothetical protein